MLILQPKVGEGILLGERIRVQVLAINPWSVRLSIEAPQDVSVRQLFIQHEGGPQPDTSEPVSDKAAEGS